MLGVILALSVASSLQPKADMSCAMRCSETVTVACSVTIDFARTGRPAAALMESLRRLPAALPPPLGSVTGVTFSSLNFLRQSISSSKMSLKLNLK